MSDTTAQETICDVCGDYRKCYVDQNDVWLCTGEDCKSIRSYVINERYIVIYYEQSINLTWNAEVVMKDTIKVKGAESLEEARAMIKILAKEELDTTRISIAKEYIKYYVPREILL